MKLMKFAWPCLLPKSCVDPAAKYHGHLLLAIIIAKFSIHRKIVLQVFHSLLKAHATEVRGIVRQALKILTPKIPERMDDNNNMLMHWTKKIIVEEGHSISQLVHILNLLVDHYKVYYPVRHQMIHYIITSADQLAFRGNAHLEHKQLAVDLTEIIIKWEIMRLQEQQKLPPGINPIEMSDIFERKSKLPLPNFRERIQPIEHHIERLFEASRINVQPDLPENRR
ncbi:Transformation/transcription domain-associated protein, partial [Stegodyphus mimosarum]